MAGRRVDISLKEHWNGRPPPTQIVAIGAPGAIEKEVFRDKFEQCLSTLDDVPSGASSGQWAM